MPIIGVMGSGTTEWAELAHPLGEWLARQGYDLLTGGGGGSMLATCRAFSRTSPRQGRSVGIIPSQSNKHLGQTVPANYPNPFVDMVIVTPLPRYSTEMPADMLNRNYINILSSEVVIALPGGPGTLNELNLAVRFSKPALCFGPIANFSGAHENIERTEDFDRVCCFIIENIQI